MITAVVDLRADIAHENGDRPLTGIAMTASVMRIAFSTVVYGGASGFVPGSKNRGICKQLPMIGKSACIVHNYYKIIVR